MNVLEKKQTPLLIVIEDPDESVPTDKLYNDVMVTECTRRASYHKSIKIHDDTASSPFLSIGHHKIQLRKKCDWYKSII